MFKKFLGFTLGAGVGLLAFYLLRRYSAKQKAVTASKSATPAKSESPTMQISNPQSTARFTVRNSGPKPHGPNVIDEVNAAVGAENKITLTAKKPVVASDSTEVVAENVKEAVEDTSMIVLEGQDDFTLIEDIGPVFRSKLYESGVTTFKALSKLSPEELAEKTGINATRIERNRWAEQAAKLAAENN